VPRFRPNLGEPGGIDWTGEIETGVGLWATYMDDGPEGTSRRTLVAVEALCTLRDHLDDLCRLVRVGLAPERARLVEQPAPRPPRWRSYDDPRARCGSLWRAFEWPKPRARRWREVDDPRHRTRGRGARGTRLRQGHRFREPAVQVYADAPWSALPLADELRRIQVALSPLPPPWSADIDDEQRDARGKLVSGCWTGKVYTGRRGSWCWYNAWESGVVYAPIVEALCDLRNVLDEAVATARAGAGAERRLIEEGR
jgi:hypothetical protein